MHSYIQQRLPKIQRLCEQHRVKQLWLFGSALGAGFRPDSDIDIIYEFEGEWTLERWNAFYVSLKQLFDREIDLMEYGPIKNPYLSAEIERTKQLIYAQDTSKVSV